MNKTMMINLHLIMYRDHIPTPVWSYCHDQQFNEMLPDCITIDIAKPATQLSVCSRMLLVVQSACISSA